MKRSELLALHVAVYGGAAALWPPAWPWVGVVVLLVWISVADVEHLEIPDTAAALLVLTGAARLWAVPGLSLADHLLAVVVWPLLVWAVAVGYARLRGWPGLGFGDVKLMAGIGIWLGFQATTLVLLAAALAGILTLVARGVLRGDSLTSLGTSAVAFGPFLCLSAWVVWLQGQS